MKVTEAMHSGASWINPDAPLSQIARQLDSEDIGALPVGEDDRLIGMVTDPIRPAANSLSMVGRW